MKTLLLMFAIATPSLALANERAVPPLPPIHRNAKPNSLEALRNRQALIITRNRVATAHKNLPVTTQTVSKNVRAVYRGGFIIGLERGPRRRGSR